MTDVTVDLEDLKTIVFAASTVKQIEGALASFRRDPFVQPHLQFTPAQKRLESAMRNAERGQLGTLVNFDEPLGPEELAYLKYLAESHDEAELPFLAILRLEKVSEIDRLSAKGCVEIGQIVTGAVWPGADAAALTADSTQLAVRITDRGRKKLVEAASAGSDL